ncbi:hypothetical protein L7F22_006356 [Adiantum nelumboides]|nr:hypothetical protein [Adiantum nelumboides]
MVNPQFVDECRLMFYRVYQEPPRNDEIYLKFATCFVYERCSAAKADPKAHKIAWALFAENVILSLKRNPVAWKRKVDAFRDMHGPINVTTTGDSMPGPSMQADVKGRPEPCFMSSVIKKLRAKILDIQSNNKAEVLKNELNEKKAKFFNKRDALIRREAIASAASMIQIEITSLQTRYGTLKGENATAEQLAAVKAQITAMFNAVKLIEGDDKIADMKIAVESVERDVNLLESKLSCSLHYMSFFENMMKQLAYGCTLLLSPAFYAPEEGRINRAYFYSDCVACGEPLAATNAIGVYMLPCGHKYHSMCFATTLVSKQVCVQLGCNERITETVKSMLVGHNSRASPYFQEPTIFNVKTKVLGFTNKLASVELLTVVSYSFHHFARWSDAKAAHHMSFETGRGYTENAVGVEEGNVSDLRIASPGGARKSWSDREAAKNVGHETVPPESSVLGATSEEGVEAVLGGDMDAESVFLAEFVKRFKSNKRTTTTTAPGEGPSKKTRSATQKDADKRKPCAQPEEVIIRELPKVASSTVQTNQIPGMPALLVDLNGVLVHTFCPHLKEQPPDLDSNDHSVVKEQYNTTYKLKRCLPVGVKCLSGWLGQECCEVANFEFPGAKPVFFKPLFVFSERHSGKYHEGNTLTIDDSWYKHMHNRTSTNVVLPKEKKVDYMVDRLFLWWEQWVAVEDRAGFVKSWEEPS